MDRLKIRHYRVEEKLSKSGTGDVYRAYDERLRRDVAIKILPERSSDRPAAVARFIREAKAASALNHPNIITVIDAGKSRGSQFIVMELVRGLTLREWMDSPPPLEALTDTIIQIAKALAAAHAAGIIHRDIKPENIMVRDDGYVKVLDFGLARWDKGLDASSTQTTSGTILGTLRYMSPEQARGEHVLASSDIFSLGIILYELFTRHHPFEAASELETLQAIGTRPILSPRHWTPELPAFFEHLTLQMLNRDPERRPSAEDIVRTIEDAGRTRVSRPDAGSNTRQRLVGRHTELVKLRALLDSTTKGSGLLVLVTGEPGIGKTALVEEFLEEQVSLDRNCAIGRAFSSERLAGTEAYLPVFEALEDLIRGTPSLAQVMRRHAPNWYSHVTRSKDPSAPPSGQLKTSSRQLLNRELMSFLKEGSLTVPFVLFLDDLHWADDSTIDLLTYVSSHFFETQILILATYRPEELQLNHAHFSKTVLDLMARRLCQRIDLGFLTTADVESFISLEFPQNGFPGMFPRLLHAKTEGNPFFMAEVLRYLQDNQVLFQSAGMWTLSAKLPDIERDLPQSVTGMVRRKIDRLSEQDRKLLAAASVQGFEFDSAIIGQVLSADPAEVEEGLDRLHRVHGFVQPIGEKELPNLAVTAVYRFVHFLYYDAFYTALQPARKASWSSATAHALLHFHQGRASELASQIAFLFEAARDFSQAARYFSIAADNATKIFAHNEAILLARRGLRMAEAITDATARAQSELELQFKLGIPLLASRGYGNLEVQASYDRAHRLCIELGESPRLFPALWGLESYYAARLELPAARDIADQLLRLSQESNDVNVLLAGHLAAGVASYLSGHFEVALKHLTSFRSLDNASSRVNAARHYGLEPGLTLRIFESRVLWITGFPDRSLTGVEEALGLARSLSHEPTLALVIALAATIHQLRGDIDPVEPLARELIARGTEHDMQLWIAEGLFFQGWVHYRRDPAHINGIDQMRDGLAQYSATGTQLLLPYGYATLAECYGVTGQPSEGLQVVREAQRLPCFKLPYPIYLTADLLRVEADLLIATGDIEGAEARLIQSLTIARQQGGRYPELRAAVSLCKLRKGQHRMAEAYEVLTPVLESFTEGFDTRDLREARAELL